MYPAIKLVQKSAAQEVGDFVPSALGLERGKLYDSLWIALCVIAAGTLLDAGLLLRFPEAMGVDGYYYVTQVKQLTLHGHLYYGTSTQALFYIARAMTTAMRGNYVLAIKVTALVLNFILTLGVFQCVSELTGNSNRALWAPVICYAFGSHMALIAEFLKELGAITCIVWAMVLATRWLKTHSRLHFLCSLGLVALSTSFHRSALVVVAAAIVCAVLARICHRNRNPIVVLVCLAWIVPPIARMCLYPNSTLFGSARSSTPPAAAWWPPDRLLLLFVSVGLLSYLLSTTTLERKDFVVLVTLTLIPLCVTSNPSLVGSFDTIQGRLLLTSYLQAAILVPVVLQFGDGLRRSQQLYLRGIIAALVLLGAATACPVKGVSQGYMLRRQELIRGLSQMHEKGAQPMWDQLPVIASHGDEFVVTAVTGLRAQQHWAQELGNVYWLLDVPDFVHLPNSTIKVSENRNQNVIVLINDSELKKDWAMLGAPERALVRENNPDLLTAGFALR